MTDRRFTVKRCPVCGAFPGNPCRGAYGPVPWIHAGREPGQVETWKGPA